MSSGPSAPMSPRVWLESVLQSSRVPISPSPPMSRGLLCYSHGLPHPGRLCFDATRRYRDVGRLINHSATLNLQLMRPFYVLGKWRVAFLAKTDIRPGEEVTYDYGVRTLAWMKKQTSSSRAVKHVNSGDGRPDKEVGNKRKEGGSVEQGSHRPGRKYRPQGRQGAVRTREEEESHGGAEEGNREEGRQGTGTEEKEQGSHSPGRKHRPEGRQGAARRDGTREERESHGGAEEGNREEGRQGTGTEEKEQGSHSPGRKHRPEGRQGADGTREEEESHGGAEEGNREEEGRQGTGTEEKGSREEEESQGTVGGEEESRGGEEGIRAEESQGTGGAEEGNREVEGRQGAREEEGRHGTGTEEEGRRQEEESEGAGGGEEGSREEGSQEASGEDGSREEKESHRTGRGEEGSQGACSSDSEDEMNMWDEGAGAREEESWWADGWEDDNEMDRDLQGDGGEFSSEEKIEGGGRGEREQHVEGEIQLIDDGGQGVEGSGLEDDGGEVKGETSQSSRGPSADPPWGANETTRYQQSRDITKLRHV